MPGEDSEIQALREQVAALTRRVFTLEQHLSAAGALESRPDTSSSQRPTARETNPEPITAGPETPAPRATNVSPHPAERIPFASPGGRLWSSSAGSAGRFKIDAAAPSLEKKIGQYWLNRIGILAVLAGVAYFLKLAFDNHWIGESGRIVIGLLAGSGLIVWSERFRSRGHKAFSYSLKALGIGTLYLSLWAAFQLYHLIPSAVAFVAMIVVTAATITFSLTQNSQLLAAFALLGGFSTPLLVSTGQNHEVVLLTYVAILDLSILVMVWQRPWRRLIWGSFAGTIILFAGWFFSYYSREQRPLTVFFAVLLFGIFAALPLVTRISSELGRASVTRTILPLLNAGMLFLALWAMYSNETATLTWYCLALAAAYLGLAKAIQARSSESDRNLLNLLHVAVAIAFITIAIPLKLQTYSGYWTTIGWLVESAALLWVAARAKAKLLGYFAVVALALGLFRLLVVDNFRIHTLIWNPRFATYLLAIAILAAIAKFGPQVVGGEEMPAIRIAGVAANVLALFALTLEARDYFQYQITAAYQVDGWQGARDFTLARDFTYSAIWLVYGAALMVAGFSKRSAFLRWQALVLIGVTIVKVFTYDVSELQRAYRVLSFIALGVVLLGISFVYQRDWLKLSGSDPRDVQQTSA